MNVFICICVMIDKNYSYWMRSVGQAVEKKEDNIMDYSIAIWDKSVRSWWF